MDRGTFAFEVSASGDLINSPGNVEKLRRLWLDRDMIKGGDLGPGEQGDFDVGAWHVGCHLVAAGGVRRTQDGRLLWLEISHDAPRDLYFASTTAEAGAGVRTSPIDSPEARELLRGSTLLGFIEGNSLGHVSARGAGDDASRFNGWLRQEYDRSVDSQEDGGKVWEHWCTLRDIRRTDPVGSSVLSAYVALVAELGDRFVPTVARGRRDYGHPKQLCALVRAGFTSQEASTWDTTPIAVPAEVEKLLLEARPGDALAAARKLSWDNPPCYYMFKRRIDRWSSAAAVTRDLRV
ncbi:MAG: hypothetical protein V2A71_02525 [Candidatus Eisenbacteria bacterium]